jgi:hypothetical protein
MANSEHKTRHLFSRKTGKGNHYLAVFNRLNPVKAFRQTPSPGDKNDMGIRGPAMQSMRKQGHRVT